MLSLVIITKNEEHNLKRCIESVPFASDIVVLDSGSSDNTVALAKNLKARVFEEPWRGFGPQKKRAVELAQYDAVLCLDADEALSKGLQKEISDLLRSGPITAAYECPRQSYYLTRFIRHGGWYPDYQLRLFDRTKANWSDSQIHEKVSSPQVFRLKNPIDHYVFRDIAHQVETNNRYSSLLSQNLKSFSVFKLIVKPISKFFETYFWKLGFLDGLPGLIISVSAGYSVFLKWSKKWEKEQQ